MSRPALIDAAIEAHGGAARWSTVGRLDAVVSASGFLFTAKQRQPLRRQAMHAWAREPRFAFDDWPAPGETTEWHNDTEVRILGTDGRERARRARPRAAFASLRRLWRWDDLDFAYFAGYATWNYLLTPFLFLQPGFRYEPLPDLPGEEGPWRGLRATFPPGLTTHSPVQDFYFDRQHRLRRLDYTAQVVGGWAHAAHLCHDHQVFDGLLVPTRRVVKPLLLGRRPLPGPTLVALQIHDLRVQTHEAA